MHAEASMNPRTINAQENPIRDGRPSRILRVAIEAHLINYKTHISKSGFQSQTAKNTKIRMDQI